ncbi:MAG: hypothetical protein NWE96_07280 [Candidatus Bathyarchaeota archaeon]|nr:hypothetical protein [Candidatus Bathyarchaeota archaeon]
MAETLCFLSQSAEPICNFISSSKKFLKIVTFRFDSEIFGDLLLERARNNVAIEIVTTPPDNVAKDRLRSTVEAMYENLKNNHVAMHLCAWEAGEPRLTTTSMSGNQSAGIGEKWYSLHLQILINENEALITSRPLTNDATLDVFYRSSEKGFANEVLITFEKIKRLFFEPKKVGALTVPGEAITFLDQKTLKETIALFEATGRLNAKHYEVQKLPKAALSKGIFISPFDGKMRDRLYDFIDSANHYAYFFLETFFDEELVGKLQEKRASNPNVSIKIITCPPERIRQSPQKARELISQVLSSGIQIGNLPDIQAKFWLSDKWLALSSGDFNRMNLGHTTSSRYWKADTQLLLLDDNPRLISEMRRIFEERFNPIDPGKICVKDVTVMLKRLARNNNLSGSADACRYLSRFKSALMLRTEQDVRYVIDVAIKMAKFDGKSRLEGTYMLMAIILHYLQRREHRLDEIVEKLELVESEPEIRRVVTRMEQRGQLLKSGEFYRITPKIGGSPSTLNLE